MWNQAHGSAVAGAGGSNASSATRARSSAISNTPPTHRRVGGVAQAQPGSSSNSAAFSRPFANVAFPGTVSVPRSSAAAPISATAPPKSIQHLSLLTTQTPAAIARLTFPPQTTVYWHHLQRTNNDTLISSSHDDPSQEASASTSRDDFQWRNSVQHVIGSATKSRLRSQAKVETQEQHKNGLHPLLTEPLIYTSFKGTTAYGSVPHSSPTSAAELWIFVVLAEREALTTSKPAATGVETTATQAAQTSIDDPKASAIVSESSTQQNTTDPGSTPLDAILARRISPDLAKALARLSALANVSSGSYCLSAAASSSFDAKGKQSSMTSEQRKAHKRFILSVKARAIDSMAAPQSPSAKPSQANQVSKRSRLRLGECVVFLPSRRPDSDGSWFAVPRHTDNLAADGTEATSLITQLDVSLAETCLLVHATTRHIALHPLSSTRYPRITASLSSSTGGQSMLISPIGHRVELVDIMPLGSIAHDHLPELRSIFARLNDAEPSKSSDDDATFASGFAICVLSSIGPSSQSDHAQLQQPQVAAFAGFPQSDTDNQDRSQLNMDVEHNHSQSQPVSRRFLWPVEWCVVVQSPSSTSTRAPGSGHRLNTDLHTMQSQPMTPLKELAAFTLKVLNEANEASSAPETAPYTPGETDDAALARHRADHLPSTRPQITPSSIALPDFDFAMPAPESASSSSLPLTAHHSVPDTSSTKRENASIEPGQITDSTNTFGQDLNWMSFLPAQSSEGDAAALAASTNGQDTASRPGTAFPPDMSGTAEAKQTQGEQFGSNWLFPTGSTSAASQGGESIASQALNPATSRSLQQPYAQMLSSGSTPQPGSEMVPLGSTQSTTAKRKAGEGDLFDNMGLLTEDDFSFFDESAFGLDPGDVLPQNLDQPAQGASQIASSHHLNFDGRPHTEAVPTSNNPPASAAAIIDDVAMPDIGQSSLDDLFSAIPGLQDVMDTSGSLQAQSAAPTSMATSASAAQAARSQLGPSTAPDAAAMLTTSSHGFHPGLSSFTPRDASGATPFGDPASLPGFTPSSLTESSPAFGNPQYKTPRTPYSPVEEDHDGATIVDLQNRHRLGGSLQNYRDRDNLSAPDSHASGGHPLSEQKGDPYLNDDQLRLADASTAAAAAANAAMDTDGSSRKRPAIVPNAFRPLTKPEARKPLQRLPAGVRANLGRKYDLLGKFASGPKISTATATASSANKASTTEPRPSSDARDRQSAPQLGRSGVLASRFGSTAAKKPPSKTLSRRGQSLLQLRRDRNSKASPASSLLQRRRSSSSRMLETSATPRSSDDFAMPGPLSSSDDDSSSNDDEDDSDDALSVTEGTLTTLSADEQSMLGGLTGDIVASYLCGARDTPEVHPLSGASEGAHQSSKDVVSSQRSTLLPYTLSQAIAAVPGTESAAKSPRATLKRSMLSRTASWLIQNPQFRSMYTVNHADTRSWLDIATSEKVEVLEAMASGLSIGSSAVSSSSEQSTDKGTALALPNLGGLVKPLSSAPSTTSGGEVEVAEVLEQPRIAVGCQGSVVETLPSALTLWDKCKLSAVSGEKHVVAKVLLTDASPAWHEEIVAWLDRLRVVFETHGLGTHVGGAQSILAVADGSESLALSSCLDGLYSDGETWLDTLRSISSRVQVDLLQGKHVVVYTLQPLDSAPCSATGFHGLLRLEADLRAMLSEQVGVLAEQLLVRPVSPSMMTESGSLGFNQQSHALRRLAFSVYDQLPRLVRRQPAKVLHGREAGPISAVVQFPAFSLSSNGDAQSPTSAAAKAGRTKFSLSWPQDPAAAVDEDVLLHISYRICKTGQRQEHLQTPGDDRLAEQGDGSDLFDASHMSRFRRLADVERPPSTSGTSIVAVSAIDERGGSSAVDAIATVDGDSSVEACIERVWRFALAEASRARLDWRLAISGTGCMSQREVRAWQRLIDAYLASTEVHERVVGSVVLASVRTDESGAVVTERGTRIKPSQEWATLTTTSTTDRSGLMLLDAADFSQMVKFAEPMPLGWTQAFGASRTADKQEDDDADEEQDRMTAMPVASALLVHRPRREPLSSRNNGLGLEGRASASHVLAVDMLQAWTWRSAAQSQAKSEEAAIQEQTEREETMDAMLRSLHRLRLISEERHELPWPWSAQPWSVASVNTLASRLEGVVLVD